MLHHVYALLVFDHGQCLLTVDRHIGQSDERSQQNKQLLNFHTFWGVGGGGFTFSHQL